MKTDKKGTGVYEKDIHVSHRGQCAAIHVQVDYHYKKKREKTWFVLPNWLQRNCCNRANNAFWFYCYMVGMFLTLQSMFHLSFTHGQSFREDPMGIMILNNVSHKLNRSQTVHVKHVLLNCVNFYRFERSPRKLHFTWKSLMHTA